MNEPLRIRGLLFGVADCLFLLLVGVASVVAMRLAHELEWNMGLTVTVGMAAAMGVEILALLCVTGPLGSIEAGVPAMPLAMLAPMAICALDLAGRPAGWTASLWLGSASALAMFGYVKAVEFRCRRRLRRARGV